MTRVGCDPYPPTVDAPPDGTTAVIIGAGPAGLASAACLARAGASYVLLEREHAIASAWHRHYDRLHLHTPKQHSALPHLPFPDDYPTYPSREQVIAYLEAYQRAFDLRPRLGEPATAVRYLGDGAWETVTPRAAVRSHAVIVATGLNARPRIPQWPGRRAYRGVVLHSAAYRSGAPFAGQDVLVVGFGNSGGEIAIDLVEHGARAALAVRSGVNVMPRDVLGIPLVSVVLRLQWLPPRALDAVAAPIRRLRVGDLTRYGLRRRAYGPATQLRADARIPLIDVGTIDLIRRGRVAVYPGIARFAPRGVEFADGRAARFDAVVLATGYDPALDFLEGQAAPPPDPRGLPKRGDEGWLPGLFFVGFHVTSTGTFRQIGIEARRIAARLTGRPQAA